MSETQNFYKPEKLIDDSNNTHNTVAILGEGGQGRVVTTTVSSIAIKFTLDEDSRAPITDVKLVQQYKRQVQKILTLPIPSHLPITIPKAPLRDRVGYTMEMLPNMKSWKDTFSLKQHQSELDDWPQFYVNNLPDSNPNTIELVSNWVAYASTGSAKRRLFALYKASLILQELHSRGILYGDVSDNNIYIDQKDINTIWFIDADNLRYDSSRRLGGFQTEGFGAPELNSEPYEYHIESDCHSFAVLAFLTLTGTHPFLSGETIQNAEENDWEQEGTVTMEVLAAMGGVPWIGDENDTSNSSHGMFDRNNVISSKLYQLFDQTFTNGRNATWTRPSIFHWTKYLIQAHDTHIKCPTCLMSFDASHLSSCCWCKSPAPKTIQIRSFTIHNEKSIDDCTENWVYILPISQKQSEHTYHLPRRIFFPFEGTRSNETFLTLIHKKGKSTIKKTSTSLEMTFQNGRRPSKIAPTSVWRTTSKQINNKYPCSIYTPKFKRLITIVGLNVHS